MEQLSPTDQQVLGKVLSVATVSGNIKAVNSQRPLKNTGQRDQPTGGLPSM